MTFQLPEQRLLPRALVLLGVALVFTSAVAWFPASLGFVFFVFWSPFLVGEAFPNLRYGSWLFGACWAIQGAAFICAWVWALRAWDRFSVSYAVSFVSVVLALLGFYYFLATHTQGRGLQH